MSMDPVIKENPDACSHLFFIYNNPAREVVFSSLPMEDFFETSINLQQSFPFLNTDPNIHRDQNQTQGLEKNWQKCQHLKEKETGNFSFSVISRNNNPVLFRFDALGINSPVHNSKNPMVLFAVNKYRAIGNKLPGSKNPDYYQKDYAEFIEIAAHDLDAPLRKISLLVDRLVHKNQAGTGSDLQVYVERILTSLAEMRLLVDNLSTWATMNSIPSEITGCDSQVIVNETLDALRYKYPDKKITATYSALPLLEGDMTQYRELFHHLLKNAVSYGQKDEPVVINITAKPLPHGEETRWKLQPGKNYSMIRVSDEGIGFGHEYAEKIFRPFTRLHGKSEYPGTGMGLAICKKIVENHGGIIYAEPIQNKGATFTLILPQCH